MRTDVEPGGAALLGVPLHPFGGGGFGDVLQGCFLDGGDWLSADAASWWSADSQSWSNAWFGAGGEWQGLEDLRFVAGDALYFHNRQGAPLSVFVKGSVPFDDDFAAEISPGFNLAASPCPAAAEAAGVERALGAGF